MSESYVAETVRFRSLPGYTPDEVRARAEAISGWLAACPGFLGRTLSADEDGIWTDHVLWQDHVAAMTAGAQIMTLEAARPFMEVIDGSSVVMSHGRVHLCQGSGPGHGLA